MGCELGCPALPYKVGLAMIGHARDGDRHAMAVRSVRHFRSRMDGRQREHENRNQADQPAETDKARHAENLGPVAPNANPEYS